jgi:hypothetical protein
VNEDADVDPSRAIRVTRLADQGREDDLRGTTAAERWAMVWQLTLEAWAFRGEPVEQGFQRDVGRVVRRER